MKVDLNMPANKREQALFLLVLAALLFGFFRMLYSPQGARLGTLQGQVKNLAFEKDTLQKLALPPEDTAKPLSRKKGVKMKILAGDVTSVYRDVPLLLARLTEPGLLGQLALRDFGYKPSEKAQGYEKTDFQMKVQGTFNDVLRYVERMEEFPALFSIENLSVYVIDGQPQEVESEISGRFYRIEDSLNQQAAQAGGAP